jgi:hypothetical protein
MTRKWIFVKRTYYSTIWCFLGTLKRTIFRTFWMKRLFIIFSPTSSTNVLQNPVNIFNFTIMWISMCAFFSLKMKTIKTRFFFLWDVLVFPKLNRPFILIFSFSIFNQDRCLNFTEIFWPIGQSIFYLPDNISIHFFQPCPFI